MKIKLKDIEKLTREEAREIYDNLSSRERILAPAALLDKAGVQYIYDTDFKTGVETRRIFG